MNPQPTVLETATLPIELRPYIYKKQLNYAQAVKKLRLAMLVFEQPICQHSDYTLLGFLV